MQAAMKRWNIIVIAALFPLLHNASCMHGPGSIDGVCESFPGPQHVIRGANRPSQRWIDTTIERGIAVCRWQRPTAQAPVIKP